ncbi:MAG: glycoside hydrolase family 38 C-terminal domain-containing protein [Acidobacteriota bacterium]
MKRLSIVFLCLSLGLPLAAQTRTLWQIGSDDQSSLEYRAGSAKSVHFHVGRDKWETDWPGDQKIGATYTISFDLEGAPTTDLQLQLMLLTYQPRIPVLGVAVNGHQGTFYLHPVVSTYLGDQRSIFDPHYSSTKLAISIPAEYLKVGTNSLQISSSVDHSPDTDLATPSGWKYDFVRLVEAPRSERAPSVAAKLEPTIFYHLKDGRLCEVVEATVRFRGEHKAGEATLTVAGKSYSAAISDSPEFGEVRLDFDVPEWTGEQSAKLDVRAGADSGSFTSELTPARKWTLFVVPHTHVDVGYTDYQGKVAEAQARTLEEAAELVKKYPDFKFTTDGSWNLQQFLESRSPDQQKEMLDLIRAGKIGVPAQYVNLLTSYSSLETLYRSLYYERQLSKKNNLPYVYANTTDVPTYTGAYPSILASAGIKYWVVGANNDRAPMLSHEAWNEKSPFWWAGPDGKKVLFWYSRCYEQVMFMFGLPPQQFAVQESLPIFLQAYSHPEYKPDVALIYGTQQENTDLVPETARFATTWNKEYVYPKLRYSRFDEYFDYLEKHYGASLPTYTGDMSGYWEDGIGSDALNAARDRSNQNDAVSAEVVATGAHEVNAGHLPPRKEVDEIWNNILLFSEHTWDSANSVTQPESDEAVKQLAVKDNYPTQARFLIDDVTNRALSQLVNDVRVPADTLVVFNSLSWPRNAQVETDLKPNEEITEWGSEAPSDVEVLSQKDGLRHVRFLAMDLPAVGYKCFRIRAGAKRVTSVASVENRPVIENKFYRVTVDPESGSIQSIFDKEVGRELVDQHGLYKFGQYLYVTGGDGKTRMINPFKSLPLGDLKIHASAGGKYEGVQKTAWGSSIRLRSMDVNTPEISLEVRLYDNEKKIELHYKVRKDATTAKEAVYFAFPAAVAEPKFAYSNQLSWVDPAKDVFKGGSLEWFSVQQWMVARDAQLTVGVIPVDAPLASLGDINRGMWPGEFHPASTTMFSYAMNNYWHTNYRASQGGDFEFRYVVTSAGKFDPARLTRLALESMRAPSVDRVVHQDKAGNPERRLSPEATSFLSIDSPNVILENWKIAEDGEGTILRLREISGQDSKASVKVLQGAVRSASLDSSVEDDLAPLGVNDDTITVSLKPHEVVTVRLRK